jgi:plasmid replication initiation protein
MSFSLRGVKSVKSTNRNCEFRNRLGLLDDEYTAMHNFKKRVLEPSIQQINEHTDINVTYEQHKKGLFQAFHSGLNKNNSQKLKSQLTRNEIQIP